MTPTVSRRDDVLAGAILAGLLVILLIAGGLHVPFPSFNQAESAWRAVIGGIAGLVVLAAGVAVIYLAVGKRSITGIILGVIVMFIALPLVDVAVGLPAPVKPFFDLLQFIVNLLNTVLHWLGGPQP